MLIFIGLHRWIYNVVRGICSFTFLLKYIIWKMGHNVVNSANFEMKIHVLWDAALLHGVKLEQLFSLVCLALKMKLKKKPFQTATITRPMTRSHIQERLASSAI